jgi:hypothetical protein
MKNYKCRFHLGAGEHFLHWRIENLKTKEVNFYNPKEYSFTFTKAFLRNQKSTAKKINEGANKSVCAWIECDNVITVKNSILPDNLLQVSYNPKIAPNWRANNENVDGRKYETLVTFDNKVFINA